LGRRRPKKNFCVGFSAFLHSLNTLHTMCITSCFNSKFIHRKKIKCLLRLSKQLVFLGLWREREILNNKETKKITKNRITTVVNLETWTFPRHQLFFLLFLFCLFQISRINRLENYLEKYTIFLSDHCPSMSTFLGFFYSLKIAPLY
jgi:hypothetical protein